MAGGFQTAVNTVQAPAVAGDFASANPRFTVDAGERAIVVGLVPLTIARFAWLTSPLDNDNAPAVANNFGAGVPDGFVHREQQGLITAYLDNAEMSIPPGFPVTLFNGGDFWVVNDGSTQALRGQKAFANLTNGKIRFAAAGAAAGQAASTTASVAASTFSVTGSIAGNLLSVTAVGSGTIVPGATISGTGVATGTKVVSQASGTAGGIGTYYVDIGEQTVASTTVSGTYGTMTVTAVGSGAVVLNGVIAGSGVVAGTKVTAFGTGTGGTGTYIVDNNTVVSSTTVTETTDIETKWYAMSSGLAGELVKMSDHALG